MGSFCAYCGKPIVEGANFCVSCGKPVVNVGSNNSNVNSNINANSNTNQLPVEPVNNQPQYIQQVTPVPAQQYSTPQYSQVPLQPQYTNQNYQTPNNPNLYVNNTAPYKPKEISLFGLVPNYFFGGFSGRCGVLELWLTGFAILFLELIFIGIPCGAAFYYFRQSVNVQYVQIAITVVNLLLTLINFLPSIMMTTRRLHDLDLSGWWQLFFYVPVLGQLFMLYVIFVPGTNGHNTYG